MKNQLSAELVSAAREAKEAMEAIYAGTRREDGMIDWGRAALKERDVIHKLNQADFTVKIKWDNTSIAAGGRRASSTTGLLGALNNWLARDEATPR